MFLGDNPEVYFVTVDGEVQKGRLCFTVMANGGTYAVQEVFKTEKEAETALDAFLARKEKRTPEDPDQELFGFMK